MLLFKTIFTVSFFNCFWSCQIMTMDNKKPDLINQLKSLQQSQSLIRMKNPVMDKDTMKKMKLRDLNDHISNEYRRIQCSYMISCIYYLNTARGLFLLSDEDKSKVNMTDLLKDISFKTAATYMLASLKKIEYSIRGMIEILWIFYIYLERFTDKLKKARTTENLTVLLPSHDAVTKLFELAFESNQCFELSHPEDDVRFDVVKKIGESSTDMEKKLKDFVKLKEEVKKQLQYNHNTCGIIITGSNYYNIKNLLLTNVILDRELMKNLQEVFGLMEDWTEFNESNIFSFFNDYDNPNLSLYNTIQSMGRLLFNFIQMLKVIMLRIILEFFESMRNFFIGCLKLTKKIFKIVKNDFIPLLYLHKDRDMQHLIVVLKPPSRFVICQKLDSRIQTVKDILSGIRTIPRTDFTKNLIKYEDAKKSQADLINIAIEYGGMKKHTIDSISKEVFKAKAFYECIKRKLKEVDFETINGFIRVKNSPELEDLEKLEKGHPLLSNLPNE